MTDEYKAFTEKEIESFSNEDLRSFVKILQERITCALKKTSLFPEIIEDLQTRDQLQKATIEMLTDVNETLHGGFERLRSEIAELKSQKPKL